MNLNNQPGKVKKFFIKHISGLACTLVKLAFRNKIVKKTPIDYAQNYFILCTHGSGFDIFHTMAALRPMKYAIVAARKLFYKKFTGKFLRISGAIPKKQFVADLAALKLVKNAAEEGKSIFICPEGRSTPDGLNGYIAPAISKMVKWLGLPVLFVKPQGSYLTFPRWAKNIRFGKMTTEVGLLLTKREVGELSNEEIYDKIKAAFSFNEYDYQIGNNLKFLTGAPAKNINRLLFICPHCNSSDNMTADSKEISCKACGLKAEVDTKGTLTFKDGDKYFERIDQWVAFQKNQVAAIVKQEGFSYTLDTDLYFEDDLNMSYKKAASGSFRLDRTGVTFSASELLDGVDKEKYSKIFYPASSLLSLSYETHGLELYKYDTTQKYRFKEDIITYKIDLFIEAIFNLTL
jgi:1-acyl-sn-glycerol-3-phosphate acyltransferase